MHLPLFEQASGDILSPALWTLIDTFDQAWQSGAAPAIAASLAAADDAGLAAADRRRFIEELLKIDMEYRWRDATPPTADDFPARPLLNAYAKRFAALGNPDQWPAELIAEEYRVRRRWGDRPAAQSYAMRFPTRWPELEVVLARIDDDLARERLAIPGPRPTSIETPASEAFKLPATEGFAMPPASAWLRELSKSGVLTPEQLAQLQAVGTRTPLADTRLLAREALRRGWLTVYQINQLLRGDGQSLILGSYVVLERLGKGGVGDVFKARHRRMNRLVALKFIRAEPLNDPDVVSRFYREIQVIGRVEHANVVRSFDAGPIGATHVLVMEYVEGQDLNRVVKEFGPLPMTRACDYIRQAALGLRRIHEQGLVHRDIKPANLMLTRAADGDVVKILDLGLARLRQVGAGQESVCAMASSHGTLTPQDAALVGTPDYLAPEQALDFHNADIRSDIYSLGCTFYFLLTGQTPFPGTSLAVKLLKHQQAEPPDVPGLPSPVADVLRCMLAKKPADRYQTPAEVAAALERARSDSLLPAAAKRWSRSWRNRCAMALLLLGGLAIAGVCAHLSGDSTPSVAALAPTAPGKDPKAASIATGAAAPGATYKNSIGMTLLSIPGGVGIKPLYVGKYEVTVGEFRHFADATKYQTDAEKNGAGCINSATGHPDPKLTWRAQAQSDNLPISCLSARDAQAFCAWLSAKEKASYRLPAKHEWEHACRAGGSSLLPWKKEEQASQYAWLRSNSKSQFHPVGELNPNAWGLCDMIGNVEEYCVEKLDQPTCFTSGGHCYQKGHHVRFGEETDPARPRSACGFRVFLDPSAPPP